MPVTLRFQSTGTVPGNGRPATMRGPSLTIGRADDNDLVLPDPDRQISKHHCAIEDRDGNIVIIDMSTNGTFLNYGKTPLGSVPTPLNDGDILSMGSYELLVEIPQTRSTDPAADLPPPLEDVPPSHGVAQPGDHAASLLDEPGGDGDFLDELLDGPAQPGGPSRVHRPDLADDGLLPPLGEGEDDLLGPAPDPQAGQGASQSSHSPAVEDHFQPPRATQQPIPDDWDDLLDGISPPGTESDEPFGAAAAPASTAPLPTPEAAPDPVPPAVQPQPDQMPQVASAGPGPGPGEVPTASQQAAASEAAARAFLKAAGAGSLQVSDAELVPTMARMGHVMRILIQGIREVLMTRTSIKSEFRINQTMISSGGNNPLKFSISPEQAVEAMIKPTVPGYLDATEAAENALSDIKAHEIAMMTGMEAAIKGVLARLSPEQLEAKIETRGGIGGILKGKKARYWEVYTELFSELSDQAENDFHELFSKEFARAYQQQLERLK
jgi:type VI secretion system protein